MNSTASPIKHSILKKTAALSLMGLAACATLDARQPNVIIILTDDQGMGDLSFYGNPVVETPHLDRLAQEGVSFDQFHVTAMCSPTRAALLTGMNPMRNGTISTTQGLSKLREGYPTIASALKEGGYATGLFGKWHLGRNWPHRPEDRGFEETVTLYGFGTTGISSRWNNDYVDTWVVHNGVERQMEGFCTDGFFNETMRWIQDRDNPDQPFFAFISTNAPHFPYWAPHDLTEKYKDTKNPEFFAMIDNLDTNMGRLDQFLKEQELFDDTIVMFLTDNGAVGGYSTYNAGMTGHKTQPWEGGHRVPLFVRYPARNIDGGRVIKGLTDVTDIFPTLLDLCGVPAPENADFDGINLSWIMQNRASVPERMRYMLIRQHDFTLTFGAVMRGDWRLLWGNSLYNINEDLAQTNDLAREHPDLFLSMWKSYMDFWNKWKDHAMNHPAQKIGSEHQKMVILDASTWMDRRADGHESVRGGVTRNAGPEGGVWKVESLVDTTYRITVRRWPVESGLALTDGCPPFHTRLSGKPLIAGRAFPIDHATLSINGRLLKATATDDPTAITFEVQLDKGVHTLHGIFRDADGNALCGTFYAYVTPAPHEAD